MRAISDLGGAPDCAPYIVPIPGTRSIKRLLRERPVSGARYPASSMATIDA